MNLKRVALAHLIGGRVDLTRILLLSLVFRPRSTNAIDEIKIQTRVARFTLGVLVCLTNAPMLYASTHPLPQWG